MTDALQYRQSKERFLFLQRLTDSGYHNHKSNRELVLDMVHFYNTYLNDNVSYTTLQDYILDGRPEALFKAHWTMVLNGYVQPLFKVGPYFVLEYNLETFGKRMDVYMKGEERLETKLTDLNNAICKLIEIKDDLVRLDQRLEALHTVMMPIAETFVKLEAADDWIKNIKPMWNDT